MNWKYKALLQLVLSNLPFGERINYLFQRHITKNVPISDGRFLSVVSVAREHIEFCDKYLRRRLKDATFYEFGAGWDLAVPLAFYAFGVDRQVIVDIRNLVRVDLVNDVIEKFQRMPFDADFQRKPNQFLGGGHAFFGSLQKCYGIDYQAPCDARAVGLDSGSIDCITSTNTLEHIPPKDIQAILCECHRLLRDDGIISFRIDYQDHYAYFDSSISVYNFLGYSNNTWKFFTPTLHYQNRLRHRDFLELFHGTGFEILEERHTRGREPDLEIIKQLVLDKRFGAYSPEELVVRNALVILRKRGTKATN